MPRKQPLKEFVVKTRETRSLDVEYVVRAVSADSAGDIVRNGYAQWITEETAMLNGINDIEVTSIKENI